jgi:hypothetical protein
MVCVKRATGVVYSYDKFDCFKGFQIVYNKVLGRSLLILEDQGGKYCLT